MAKAIRPPSPMTVEEFVDWALTQPEGRYELVDGEVVAMAPERIAHARLKAEVWLALRDAIAAKNLPCEALLDGAGVRIDDNSLYIPDVVVYCRDRLSGDQLIVPMPIIGVEVLPPRASDVDTGGKLEGYFRLASVRHYLIVRSDRRAIIHHRRGDDDSVATRIITQGSVELDPPGITLDLDRLYA
jgi:Uma2 family endonuclease